MKIRTVGPEDSAAVIALWQAVFPEYANPAFPQRNVESSIRRKLAAGDGLFWLGEADARVIGTAMAGYDGHRGWLYSFCVHPKWRGGGHGRSLLRHAEAALHALGCPKVNLQVASSNHGGIGFWRANDYVQDDVLGFGRRLG